MRRIVVDLQPKPIPDRRFDFEAVRSGFDANRDCVGYGGTEQEAIDDLLEAEDLREHPEGDIDWAAASGLPRWRTL